MWREKLNFVDTDPDLTASITSSYRRLQEWCVQSIFQAVDEQGRFFQKHIDSMQLEQDRIAEQQNKVLQTYDRLQNQQQVSEEHLLGRLSQVERRCSDFDAFTAELSREHKAMAKYHQEAQRDLSAKLKDVDVLRADLKELAGEWTRSINDFRGEVAKELPHQIDNLRNELSQKIGHDLDSLWRDVNGELQVVCQKVEDNFHELDRRQVAWTEEVTAFRKDVQASLENLDRNLGTTMQETKTQVQEQWQLQEQMSTTLQSVCECCTNIQGAMGVERDKNLLNYMGPLRSSFSRYGTRYGSTNANGSPAQSRSASRGAEPGSGGGGGSREYASSGQLTSPIAPKLGSYQQRTY